MRYLLLYPLFYQLAIDFSGDGLGQGIEKHDLNANGELPPTPRINLEASPLPSSPSARITDEGIKYLETIRGLKKLDLYHTLVTVEGKAALERALPECEIVFDADSSKPNRRRS